MKKYKFELVIKEGNDEFWEEVNESTTGCDIVYEQIETILANYGFITKTKYAI